MLIAGGQTGRLQDSLVDAGLYEPDTGKWQPTGPMAFARTRHTATVLADGKVLVLGGLDRARQQVTVGSDPGWPAVRPPFVREAEIYDPGSGSWRETTSLPSCGGDPRYPDAGRTSHSATLLGDGKVMVVGGECGAHDLLALKEVLLYDPQGERWESAGALEVGRRQHTATLLADGTVLIAGGYSADGTPLRDAAVFDPGTASSAPRALRAGHAEHTASLLSDGKVLLVGGGRDVEIYDPGSGTTSLAGRFPRPRFGHAAALLPDGRVLVVGGRDTAPGDPAPHFIATAALYDPAGRRWRSAGSMADKDYLHRPELGLPPAGGTATTLTGAACGPRCGKVLIVGGQQSETSAQLHSPGGSDGDGGAVSPLQGGRTGASRLVGAGLISAVVASAVAIAVRRRRHPVQESS